MTDETKTFSQLLAEGREWAYALLPSEMHDPSVTEVQPIIVVRDEPGYFPVDYKWSKAHAEEAKLQMNTHLGLTPEKAEEIFQSSFKRPRRC